MATTMYGLARAGFLACTSAYSWTGANIQLAFITSSYSPNYSTDQYLGVAVSSGYIIAQSGNFASTTGTLGTANAANETVSSVSGAQFAYVTIYYSTGTNNTSGLILNIDTATGLPCTPNGGNIVVQWDSGTNKIFTLKNEVDVSVWNGIRIAAAAIGKRFGFPVLDETYRGFYAGVPKLHKIAPTPEQREKQARWEHDQEIAAGIRRRHFVMTGREIPQIGA
jgi:hypothetical protein